MGKMIGPNIWAACDNDVRRTMRFIKAMLDFKFQTNQTCWTHDTTGMGQKELTGFLGEQAVEEMLNTPVRDWTIGFDEDFAGADLKYYNIGVKTVKDGYAHIIPKRNTIPQILVTCIDYTNHIYRIDGMALPEVLNYWQDDMLIKSPAIRRNNPHKTGFSGMQYLIAVTQAAINMYRKE